MPGKNDTNLAKMPKNARRKYFRRAFYRLYNTHSGYWKKLVPVIGKTIHHQVPQNVVLIIPKTNPATANPAHRVRVFFCATPTMLNASPTAEAMPKTSPNSNETNETIKPAIPKALTFSFSFLCSVATPQ